MAVEENVQLVNSVKERLILSVSRKRAKLISGKDQLDILDTGSLVSTQGSYNLQGPTSPGAPQSNRKTRHTRHRLEVDEMGLVGDISKRRRKVVGGEVENGSPIRAIGDMDHPEITKQDQPLLEEKPLLNMSHLFTDRERVSVLAASQRQVVHDLSHERRRIERRTANGETSDVNSEDMSSSDDDNPDAQSGAASPSNGLIAIENHNGALTAPSMDRTANSSHHATRSSRLALNGDIIQRNPYGDLVGKSSIPKFSALQKERKKEDDYQRAPPLSVSEAEQDLFLMRQAMREGEPMNSGFVPATYPEVRNYVLEGVSMS